MAHRYASVKLHYDRQRAAVHRLDAAQGLPASCKYYVEYEWCGVVYVYVYKCIWVEMRTAITRADSGRTTKTRRGRPRPLSGDGLDRHGDAVVRAVAAVHVRVFCWRVALEQSCEVLVCKGLVLVSGRGRGERITMRRATYR